MALIPFALAVQADRTAVELDGQDVTEAVEHLVLEVAPGRELPTLTLHLRAGAGVVEGLAHVEQAQTPADLVETFARMLERLDPEAIEKAALNSPELTQEPYALTRAMLDEAARLVRSGGRT